ncbi:MAG: hypothetical protein IPJ32_18105 [Sphingobacteriaceae bacterium]|nr:hypothetical protein [Sphingobacteriaceae bacterium]
MRKVFVNHITISIKYNIVILPIYRLISFIISELSDGTLINLLMPSFYDNVAIYNIVIQINI